MPSLLSVTELNVPLLPPLPRPKPTVKPPLVCWFPAASLAVNVTVAVVPDTMLVEETDTMDWDRLTTPGVTVIVGKVEVTALPPMVAVMVRALPAVVPVNVAL